VKTTSSLGKFLSSRQPYQTIAAFGSGILFNNNTFVILHRGNIECPIAFGKQKFVP
jgi:hypothetical protein